MKKSITFLICLLIASIGWVLAQQAKPVASALAAKSVQRGAKHLYLRGGKTHLVLQPTRNGTRVYRQVGQRIIPMN